MKLRREVEIRRHLMRAHHVLLAVLGCAATLLASQQCAGQARARLDAAVARDPLPRSFRPTAYQTAVGRCTCR